MSTRYGWIMGIVGLAAAVVLGVWMWRNGQVAAGSPAAATQPPAGQTTSAESASVAPAAIGGVSRASPAIPAPAPVVIQEGKTIDFSSGRPVVRDTPDDKAAIDAALREMEEAAKDVTFGPDAAR